MNWNQLLSGKRFGMNITNANMNAPIFSETTTA